MNNRASVKPKNKNSTTFSRVFGKKLLDRTLAIEPTNRDYNVSNLCFGHDFGDVQVESNQSPKQSCPLSLYGPSHCPFGGACHTCPPSVQTKLKIGQPGDKYEQEADRVADLWGRDDEFLRTRRVQANVAEEIVAPPIVNEVLRSPGQPLTPDTSAFMESRFGHDFSRVQVHTDAKAVESARAINARAYTAGQHLVFGTSQYITGTIEGRRLLAHELTHIVQQGRNIGTSVNKQPIHRQVDINGAANQLIDQGSQPTKDKCAGWKRDCQSFCIKVTKQAYRDIEGSNPPPSKHID